MESIQNAMEEAVDQEASLAYPPMQSNRGKVVVAQRELAQRASVAAVLTVPLVAGGTPIGALTLQRDRPPPFESETVVLFEAVCALLAPAFRTGLEARLGSRFRGQAELRGA